MQGALMPGAEAYRPALAAREDAGAATDERHRLCGRCGALLPAHYLTCRFSGCRERRSRPGETAQASPPFRPVIELTADEARTAYLACRDAEAFAAGTPAPRAPSPFRRDWGMRPARRGAEPHRWLRRLGAQPGGHVPHRGDGGLPG